MENDPSHLHHARILLAAGGTGGHIMPAVAVAEALAAALPGVEVRFCCGRRPNELEVYRRLNIEPWSLPVSYHRPGPRARAKLAGELLNAWREARRLLAREPVGVAVGFGSYVTAAPLLAARMAGARVVLHEPDVHAGLANRLLAPLARLITTAVSIADDVFPTDRTRLVGNPVRGSLLKRISRGEARRAFDLDPDRPVCLCLGGSQGAAGLNRMLAGVLARFQEASGNGAGWQLLWATGPNHHDDVLAALKDHGIDSTGHVLRPYIDQMREAYGAADVVVARGGALTQAELTALGKPALLVPLPRSKGGHQLLNARGLEQAGAAVVVEETAPRAAERLASLLESWAEAPAELRRMAEASRALGHPDAAKKLASLALGLAGLSDPE